MASHAPTRSTMPTFLGADTRAEAQQETEPSHMGDYFVEYQPMGRSSRMLSHSKTLFSSSEIVDPATITEDTSIIMMETPTAQLVDSTYLRLMAHQTVRQSLGWRSWTFISNLTRCRRQRPSRWRHYIWMVVPWDGYTRTLHSDDISSSPGD